MTLLTSINDSTNAYVFTIDTNAPVVDRAWPLLQVSLIETQQATLTQVYHMDLLAAPLREIWFSTASGLTASKWQSPTNRTSSGDVLSDSGRMVRPNGELLRKLGIMPGIPEIGIDAVDIARGGEIFFSLNDDVFSETLGPIHHGDLLSEHGKIVKRNQELLAAFKPVDAGLDHLKGLKHLRNLYVWQSKVTDAGVKKLKTALPNVDISTGWDVNAFAKKEDKPEETKDQKKEDKTADKKDEKKEEKKEEKKDEKKAEKKEEKKQ